MPQICCRGAYGLWVTERIFLSFIESETDSKYLSHLFYKLSDVEFPFKFKTFDFVKLLF